LLFAILDRYRGFNLGVSGLPFLAFYVTGALSFLVYCLYQKYHYIPKIKKTDFDVPPEERLELALMGAPFVGVALLLFGWLGNYPEINWIGPTIGASLYVSKSRLFSLSLIERLTLAVS
jgi:DHA1 family multidrug resistance protein-like MFS transporter